MDCVIPLTLSLLFKVLDPYFIVVIRDKKISPSASIQSCSSRLGLVGHEQHTFLNMLRHQ